MRAPLLLTLLFASTVCAQGNPELAKANKLLFDAKYAEAAKALEAAARTNGNSRDVVLRIFELQGIVYGQLGQAAKARDAFEGMLSLDPKRTLNGKFNAKVTKAYAAASDWLSTNPPLDFRAAKAALDAKGNVVQLATKLKSDALKQGRKVRFHVRPDDAQWSEQDATLQGAYAAADTQAPGIEWWAELLGENDRVLAMVGSEKEPIREGAAATRAPPVVADKPKKDEPPKSEPNVAASKVEPAPAAVTAAPARPEVRSASSGSSGPLRPLGIAMIAVGAAAVGGGAYFGLRNADTRGQITGARSFGGIVTGITQSRASRLNDVAREQAVLANTLFIAGGAVAAVGAVFVFIGGGKSSPSASLQVAPTLGGVLVSGGF